MKLLALELLAFGSFTDARLDLSGGGFHVIHGANEAGKSTAMRALTDLLFGIPNRTSDDFRHEAKKLRIGGELLAASGARLAFLRRKGNSKTLLDPCGKDLDDSALAPFLGAATRETFETIFRLDRPGLIAGGADLLEGRGNLAQSLFQAAAGITGLRRALAGLEAEAGELFKPNAAKPRVNRAWADYNIARRASRAAALKPSEWSATVEMRDQLAAQVRELRAKLDLERQRHRRIERQHAAHPHAHRRATLIQEQLALGEVTLLPPDALRQREEAEKEQRRVQPTKEEAEKHLEHLGQQLAALQTAPGLLAEAAGISNLAQRLREYRAAISELPDFSRPERDPERGLPELHRLDEEISLRIAQLGPAPAWSGAIADLERLAVPAAETVDRFEKEFANLSAEKSRLLREIENTKGEIETSRAQARAIRIGGAVPTEADLLQTRALRDRGWEFLLEKWRGTSATDSTKAAVDSAEAAAYRGNQTLETAYAEAVRKADLVSDRLRREAQRVAALATFLADAERGVARLSLLGQQLDVLEINAAEKSREWSSAWAGSGITPATPAEMQQWLRRQSQLLHLAAQRRETIRTMARETARFRAFADTFSNEAVALARRIAPELAELPPDRAVESLQARLAQAQQDAARRQQLEESIERERKALSKANREIETARLELEALFLQARCATREALLEAEARSRQALHLAAEIETENRALAGHAGSQPINLFAAEVSALDRESLEQEIAHLSQSVAETEVGLAEKQRRLGEAEAQVKAMDGGPAAAVASEEAQSFLAEARDAAEHYIRLHLAGAILRRQIERYRRENQDPVLHRASALFSTLTLQSFSGIVTGFREKDDPILLGVRPSGEEVEVSGMSEGARDQLYLALRVATLERQMQLSDPLPLVLDDVLVSFDDARARAALSVLSELCARTQVLFFTHHSHLVELARQAVPDSLRREHHLASEHHPGSHAAFDLR
jgi:uncharacterized protein YhaN